MKIYVHMSKRAYIYMFIYTGVRWRKGLDKLSARNSVRWRYTFICRNVSIYIYLYIQVCDEERGLISSQLVTVCDEDIYSYVETCLYIYIFIYTSVRWRKGHDKLSARNSVRWRYIFICRNVSIYMYLYIQVCDEERGLISSQLVTVCDEDIYSFVEPCLYIYIYIYRCAMKKGAW